MSCRRKTRWFLGAPALLPALLFLCLATARLAAAPVSRQDALNAASAWLALSPKAMDQQHGQLAGSVRAVNDSTGQPQFYSVDLAPKGFVIVAADDGVEPIIAFSNTDNFQPVKGNPLFDMLEGDVPARVSRSQAAHAGPNPKWKMLRAAGGGSNVLTAQTLTAGDGGPAVSSVNDVRVAPLIKSEWNQTTTPYGQSAYNYFTPPYSAGNPNNYDSGCVATMLSQIIRYHQWPQTGVGTASYQVTVKGSQTQRSLRGGDGDGGPYNWADMPLVASANMPAAQQQAIGDLLSDAGVASNMDYEPDGSGATIQASVLTHVFHYASADFSTGDLSTLETAIEANLDAKLPVGLGITGGGFGHAVVADGYGYNSSTLYIHLNMGWSGACNAWYNLPEVDAGGYDFNTVNSALFNVNPSITGEIISGRITDESGKPVAGGRVTLASGTAVLTATSNSVGIYAVNGLASNTKYTITPGGGAWTFTPASQSVSTGHSSSGGGMGDKTGIDFTSQPITGAVTVQINSGAVSAGAQWRVNGGSWQAGGATVPGVPAGTGTLSFHAATDWATPANQTVAITGSQTSSVQISYAPKYSLTAVPDNSANGQVSADPEPGDLGSYAPDTAVTLTATPGAGYYFGGWLESGTLVSTDATYTSVVKGSRSLVANFTPNSIAAQDTQLYVTSNKGEDGIDVLANASDSSGTLGVLSVTQPDNGTVTINNDGSLTFTPAGNFHGSSEFSYTLSDGQGGTITRTVTIANWFASSAGTYAGLSLAEEDLTNETSGYLKVTVTKSGAFSGKLIAAGKTYSLSGAFDSNANYQKVITRKDTSNLNVTLHLVPATQITGTIGDGVTLSNITANRVAFSASNKTQLAGKYTALLSGNGAVPGSGYLTVSISPTGSVSATGRLADGTPVSMGAYLNADGSLPYYAGIYTTSTSAGSVFGTMDFASGGNVQCTGTYAWFRPSSSGALYPQGFAGAGSVTGSLLAPGSNQVQGDTTPNISVGLSGGGLQSPIDASGQVQSNGTIQWISGNSDNLSLTIKPSGGVAGSFTDPTTGKKVEILGAWLPGAQTGGGYFIDGDSAGALTLSPQ